MLPVVADLEFIKIYSFGVWAGIGFLIGVFIAWRRLRDFEANEEKVIDAILVSSLVGFISSKLIFRLEHPTADGFSFWGAIISFLAVICLFSRIQKWDYWRVLDELVFAILPFSVLVQIGAFFDGSTPGSPTTMPWGIYFPGNLVRTHPTSIYTAVLLFIIWIIILKIERNWRMWSWYKSKANGLVFLLFMIAGLGVSCVIDFWTTSGLYWLWLKTVLSLLVVVVSLIILLYRSNIIRYGK